MQIIHCEGCDNPNFKIAKRTYGLSPENLYLIASAIDIFNLSLYNHIKIFTMS